MKWIAGLLLAGNVALYLWAGGDRATTPPPPQVNKEGMLLLSELPAAGDSTDRACYRLGPFANAADWQAAKQWMGAQNIAYQATRSAYRELRARRVYVGPFASRRDVRSAARRLTEKGIEHLVESRKPGETQIYLGYFTQDALAVKFMAYLLSRGIKAQSELEYRPMRQFDWMETAALPAAAGDRLLSRRWRAAGISATAIHCPVPRP